MLTSSSLHNLQQFRGACPPHKVKDLDALVKQCKGDEAKIQAQIMQWWEEPQVVEEEWVSAGKTTKKSSTPANNGASSGGGSDRTNGGDRNGSDKNRGGLRSDKKHDPRPIIAPPRRRDGRGMRDRGRGGGRFDRRPNNPTHDHKPAPTAPQPAAAQPAAEPTLQSEGGPAPVMHVTPPKGAWGQPRAAPPIPATAAAPTPAAAEPTPVAVAPVSAPEPVAPTQEVVHVMSTNDPTPSGLPPKSAAPTGNVWATRGSAHLIQAEKFKPPPPPEPVEPEPTLEEPEYEPEAEEEYAIDPEPEPELPMPQPVTQELTNFMSVDVPPSVNGANINASGWEPLEINESMSPTTEPLVLETPHVHKEVVPQPQPVLEETLPSQPVPQQEAAKPSVLNMGHWDGDDQDDDELDFGFGGFGNENVKENIVAPATTTQELAANHASPARPPPGLSMPPMPAGAILVHELENKLENTTLSQPSALTEEKNEKETAAPSSTSQPQSFTEQSNGSNYPTMNQYGAYGMGMYNMNTSNGGFASMPPGQFPLSGHLGGQQQQQPPKQSLGGAPDQNPPRSGASPALQQGVGQPYVHNPDVTTPNLDQPGPTGTNQPPNMPPGVNQIPAGMQGYPNPAFMYGQYNQMGHPYPGMQYGYAGQGQQFGVQGGFGYHQVMSGGGYGAPYGHDGRHHGDDSNHSHMRDNNHHNHHKGGGGYRHNNRNNHQGGHNNFGNNYQGGNYGGGAPYGNNYQGQYGDQFQRGGYGGNNDHYGMQGGAPYQGGGYQNDYEGNKDKHKGPHRVQQGFHQQPVGLQGASQNESGAGGGSGGGWPSSGPTGQNWGGNWQQES